MSTKGYPDNGAESHSTQCKTLCLIAIKVLVRVLLFSIVVTCTVFSKLSLISLVSRLNETIDDLRRASDSEATLHNRAAGIFWQLLFIILIPQFVTFIRALLFGVCGKQSRLFPWPTPKAIVVVSGRHNYITSYGTVSAKIAPRLKCYKYASRLNRYNFPTDNAIAFPFSTLHTTPFHYEVLNIGSR